MSSSVCPTPCHGADPTHRVSLRAALISLSFPYDITPEATVPLLTAPISLSFHPWHNPRNQESYLILSTSLPYVAHCVLTLHTTQLALSNIRLRSQRVRHLQPSKIFTDPACRSCVPTPYTPPRFFTCRRQGPSPSPLYLQRSSIDFPTHAISPRTRNSLPDNPLPDAKLHPAK
jgi:hypothetical protein